MTNDFLPRRRVGMHSPRSTQQHISHERPAIFQTPEAIARQEGQSAPPLPGTSIDPTHPNGAVPASQPRPKRSFKEWLKSRTKKQWIIFGIIAALVLIGGGLAIYNLFIKADPKPAAPVVKKQAIVKPAPVPLTSTLTGLPITDATINQRPVTAVMIENSQDARPQSGLNQAGVVFEAIAEGGITRFLTLFQDSEPDYIGPVRSVRPYYIQWLAGFDAAVAHVGGSGDALRMLREEHVAKDLDQFFNPDPYHRVSNRFAPHNMYTSVVALRELQLKKGFTSTFTGFVRKPEAKSPTPNATTIDFNISGAIYNPHYEYDDATNTYKRSEGGKPHTDEKSGQQLTPKVVIGLVMPQGSNGIYTTYQTLGSGQAFVFQDGVVIPGMWHKADNKAQFTFTDTSGAELKLNPGQTWLSVVGGADRVSYK